jgi:alpha-mannosidase
VWSQKEIDSWLVLGPFENNQSNETIDAITNTVLGDQPKGGKYNSGKIWKLYKNSIIDFSNPLICEKDTGDQFYYVSFYINNKNKNVRKRLLRLNYIGNLTLYVNGREALRNRRYDKQYSNHDNIFLDFEAGWNNVIIKMAAIPNYDFYLKGFFTDDNLLVIQTDNPFITKKENLPLRIMPLDIKKNGHLYLSESGRFLFSYGKSYLNYSQAESDKFKYQIYSGDERIYSKSVSTIKAGEILDINFNISLEELSKREKSIFTVKFFVYDREILSDTLDQDDIFFKYIMSLFSPIQVKQWDKDVVGSRLIFSREFYLPTALLDKKISFYFDVGQVSTSVRVNNALVINNKWDGKGEFILKEKSNNQTNIRIELFSNIKDRNDNPVSLHDSYICIKNDVIEKILGNLNYAKRIAKYSHKELFSLFNLIYNSLYSESYKPIQYVLMDVEKEMQAILPFIKNYTISHVGFSHADLSLIDSKSSLLEGYKEIFQLVTDLLQKNPKFKFSFGYSQPFEYVEKNHPELFNNVKKYVKEGRWELLGSSYAESDQAIPSGEFLLRGYLYGKKYFFDKFGVDANIAVSSDSYYHSESTPCVLSNCGINKYVFFEPLDNPKLFSWKSKDGSSILAHSPHNWFASTDSWNRLNVYPDKYNYKNVFEVDTLFNIKDLLNFNGTGESFTVPIQTEIDHVNFLNELKSYPSNNFSTIADYYQSIDLTTAKIDSFESEINGNFDAIFTNDSELKYLNRRVESLLPFAETFSVLSENYGNVYPKEELSILWKKALFGQSSKILSSIASESLIEEVKYDYKDVIKRSQDLIYKSLKSITQNINTNSGNKNLIPVVLFNNLNWERTSPVEIDLAEIPNVKTVKIYDELGREVVSQIVTDYLNKDKIVFLASEIPSMGYKTYWIKPDVQDSKDREYKTNNDFYLENPFYKVAVDQISGSIYSLYDKLNRKELIAESSLGNQFIVLTDVGDKFEAMLDKDKIERFISPLSVKITENGKVRKVITVNYKYKNSTLTQEIILYNNVPILFLKNRINWKEEGKFLKIKFPIDIAQPNAEFEIPFNTISRDCNGVEIYSQKFFSINNNNAFITILNDSKYSLSVDENSFTLSVVRTPSNSGNNVDYGFQKFEYGILSGRKYDKSISTRYGYEFNSPIQYVVTNQHAGKLPSNYSFVRSRENNVIITALKKSEDTNSIVLRYYETSGKKGKVTIDLFNSFRNINYIDAVEIVQGKALWGGRSVYTTINPYEIQTLQLNNNKDIKK